LEVGPGKQRHNLKKNEKLFMQRGERRSEIEEEEDD
jgi:hypothetical protein